MTQLFIGYKPNVGPVVKVLKYDTDNPLTLANTAYDRYYFNSETQALSFVSNAKVWIGGSKPDGVYLEPNNPNTFKYASSYSSTGVFTGVFVAANLKNIYPGNFVGIPEVRYRNDNGRYFAGKRDLQLLADSGNYERGIITSYQFPCALGRVASIGAEGAGLENAWNVGKYTPNAGANGWKVGDWQAIFGRTFSKEGRNKPAGFSPKLITAFWDLPANSAPLPTYTPQPNLEIVRLSQTEAIMSRPGYSVSGSSGTTQRIFDSTISPSLCIMSGETGTIAAGASVTIPAPSSLTLSEDTIVDMMVRNVGEPQYIPPFIPAGYARKSWFDFSYKVNAKNVQIFNESPEPIIVRYIVFDADASPPSTGGNQIMFRGNDGTQDYIQIKRPGTSDPASKVNDIILDTRFPMLQIIKEGYIPLSDFTSSGIENANYFGNVQHTVNFNSTGMLPFIKYMTVYPHVILSPVMSQAYNYMGVPQWGPPSNQSTLCRLTNNSAKFWLSPGNWSGMHWKSPHDYLHDCPDPLGVRYYIFGIAQ